MRLLILLLWLLSQPLLAAETQEIELPSGESVPLTVFPGKGGDRLLLWLPSEFGLSPRQHATAEALAAQGVTVWLPDLHAAWFLAPGRYSLNGVPPQAIAELLARAAESGRKVFVMAPGRSVGLALRALRRYQQSGRDTAAIRGLIAIGPRLFRRTPQGGEATEFLPVVDASNLPIFILQPRNAGGFWGAREVIERLQAGGAPVFVRVLPGVRDAFNRREDTTAAEEETTRRLPAMVLEAMRQLDPLGGLPARAVPLAGEDAAPEAAMGGSLLRPRTPPEAAPPLRLPGLDGRTIDLGDARGKVVLVNFWATWCPPCVEEIPSLQRLYRARRDQGLEILAVEVGESPEQVRAFLADKPVDFPVLLDPDGKALAAWGVHAFPTTFVLDRRHRIRFGGFGAFEWDRPEVMETLDRLLGEPACDDTQPCIQRPRESR